MEEGVFSVELARELLEWHHGHLVGKDAGTKIQNSLSSSSTIVLGDGGREVHLEWGTAGLH